MNPYSDLKPAWHLDKIAALRRGEQIVPSQIQLVLSDLCNQACGFCAYRMDGYASNQHFGEGGNNNPARFIPKLKALEILDDTSALGVKAVQFTGGGEPTVHPDHLEIFQYALGEGLQCALVTNGCLLRDGWERILPKFSWVRVSLDAGSASVYASIRGVTKDKFHRCIENIGRMAKLGVPNLGVSYIVMKENYLQVREAAKLAKQRGASYIRFAAFFSNAGARYYDGFLGAAKTELARATEHESKNFRVIDMVSQRIGDLTDGPPDYAVCGYQQFNMYIGGDQKVYRCCDTAYNDRGFVGDLKSQTFARWFSSDAKKQAYDTFDARGCERCAFNGKNRIIAQLAAPESEHVHFV